MASAPGSKIAIDNDLNPRPEAIITAMAHPPSYRSENDNRRVPILENANPGYTSEPIQEGHPPLSLPEFCRIKTVTAYTGLARGKIYEGMKQGWIKSVSLRKKGQKFAVRLIHLPSLIQHLHGLLDVQNPQ